MKILLLLFVLYFIIKAILFILYLILSSIELNYKNENYDKLYDKSEENYDDGFTHEEFGFYIKDDDPENVTAYIRTNDGQYFKKGGPRHREYIVYHRDKQKKINEKRKSFQLLKVLEVLNKYFKFK